MSNTRRPFLLLLATLILTGCSQGGSIQPVDELTPSSATARLNPEDEDIIYPLDEFGISVSELNTLERADSIRLQNCMNNAGHSVDLLSDFVDRTYVGDRPYGIWSMSNAQERGYEVPQDGITTIDLAQKGSEFNHQWDECLAKSSKTGALGSRVSTTIEQLSLDPPIRFGCVLIRGFA